MFRFCFGLSVNRRKRGFTGAQPASVSQQRIYTIYGAEQDRLVVYGQRIYVVVVP